MSQWRPASSTRADAAVIERDARVAVAFAGVDFVADADCFGRRNLRQFAQAVALADENSLGPERTPLVGRTHDLHERAIVPVGDRFERAGPAADRGDAADDAATDEDVEFRLDPRVGALVEVRQVLLEDEGRLGDAARAALVERADRAPLRGTAG